MANDGDGSRKGSLRQIAKVIGLGAALWIGSFVSALLIYHVTNIDALLAPVIFALIFIVPVVAICLLIYDLIRIVRDRDPVFWSKIWYQVLLVMGVISVVLFGTILYITTGKAALALTELAYIGQAAAADDTPTGVAQGLRQGFHIVGLFLLSVTFFVSGYITFFKEETESNKHRVQLASDIFKTVFGFITGVLTAALK